MSTIDPDDIDAVYKQHKNADFQNAKPVTDIPLLQAYQEQQGVTLHLEPEILHGFSELARRDGSDYRQLITRALREYLATH